MIIQLPAASNRLHIESVQFRSLTCSALGRALLSLKPDAEVLACVLQLNAEAVEPRFVVREREFMALITGVRTTGFAFTDGDVTPGLGAIATSVASPMSQSPVAVGVGGPIARLRRKRDAALEALRRFKAATGEWRP